MPGERSMRIVVVRRWRAQHDVLDDAGKEHRPRREATAESGGGGGFTGGMGGGAKVGAKANQHRTQLALVGIHPAILFQPAQANEDHLGAG